MRDGPLDSLDRTRGIFLASIGDGIGKADAGADFYFAALNAKRHGYVLKGSDEGLLNMFNSIIKEEMNTITGEPNPNFMRDPSLSSTLGGVPITHEQVEELPSANPLSPTGQESQYAAGLQHGGQRIPDTVWDSDRVVRPRVGQSLSGRDFEMTAGKAGLAYADTDAIRHGPLYAPGKDANSTAMIDAVSTFYLPDDPYGERRSEIDGMKELAWDKHHRTGDKDFVLGPRFYGRLPEDKTNHAQYEKHFDRWKASNPDAERELTEIHGPEGDDAVDHAIRTAHMDKARDGWLNENKLGLFDYLFGLEWHTPEERDKIYQHMKEHGVSNKGRADIDNGLSHTSRLVRNFQQRFAPMYNHWIRHAHAGGEVFEHTNIGLGSAEPSMLANFQAINSISNGLERAAENHENLSGGKFPRRSVEIAGRTQRLLGAMTVGKDGKIKGSTEKGGYMSRSALLALMHVNPETDKIYEDGKHPHYKDWKSSDATFTQDDVDHILKETGRIQAHYRAGRIARNAAGMHYYAHVDPDMYPHDVTQGEHKGLAHHWNQPFRGIGGMMGHPNTLFSLLHEHGLFMHDSKVDENNNPLPLTNDSNETKSLLFNRSTYDPSRGKHEGEIRLRLKENRMEGGTMEAGGVSRIADGMMLAALAPFGQPSPELTSFMKDKDGVLTAKTRVDQGDITDSEDALHGHIGSLSGKSDRREPYVRTAYHPSPKHANQLRRQHIRGFEENDADEMKAVKDAFNGITAGSIPLIHSKSGSKGGFVHGMGHARRKIAHAFHRIGTALGFANPPLRPSARVADMNQPRPEDISTAASHDVTSALGHPQFINDPVLGEGVHSDALSERLRQRDKTFDMINEINNKIESTDNETHKKNLKLERGNLIERMEELGADIDSAGPTRNIQQTSTERDILNSHTNAIAERARKYLPMMNPALFHPSLPLEVLEGNVMQYAAMINQMLAREPHENHGLPVLGNADTTMYEKEVRPRPSDVKEFIHGDSKFKAKASHSAEQLAQGLGLNYEDAHVQASMQHLSNQIRDMAKTRGDMELEFPMMTVADLMSRGGHYGDHGTPEEMRELALQAANMGYGGNAKANLDFMNLRLNALDAHGELVPYDKEFGGQGRTGKEGVEELLAELGMGAHISHSTDPRFPPERSWLKNVKGKEYYKKKNPADANRSVGYRALQKLNSVLVSDPTKEPKRVKAVDAKVQGVPVETKLGPMDSRSESVIHSLYNSTGFNQHLGDKVKTTFDFHIDHNGKPTIHPTPPRDIRLNGPLQSFWSTVFPDLAHILHPDYVHHTGETAEGLNELDKLSHQTKPHPVDGSQHKEDAVKKSMNLAALTNPDIIRKELGNKVPLLQPMHRIFELDDLEHLRGFTGDWIVSVMPEGERGFVVKEGDKVTSPNFSLSKDDKKNFKEVADEDFRLDVIKLEDGYYVFDVLEFDEKEVHDTVLNDRIKIIRGGMEGIENIHVPSASDTRLTDDAGLESAVDDLQEENDRVLLRDAKSTYMAGELRHPKWVLLSPGNDVVLMVLERRGSLPYTYRLGTGPITQEDSLGQRGVEVNGKTYMDMGAAFDSSEKFNVGDHVRVNVANVGEMETNGHNLYSVTGSEIIGEAEGEGLVSQETLGLLAKSETEQWLCEINRSAGGIRVTMPQGDVIYKTTQSGSLWTVHSPLAPNHYLIRLAESQRPYWAPVAGAMLKADVEIAEKEEVHDDGFEVGEAKPFVKPKKVKGTNWWAKNEKRKVLVKGMLLVEQMLKSGVGSVGSSSTGAMGLGIGYATPIESPTGPTNLHDSKTMPDYDNKRRPGEDYSIEPDTEEEEEPKHMTVPLKEGTLEVSDSTARFHS